MKSKGFINQAGILILSLLVIFTLAGCDNGSNNTSQVSKYSVSGTVLDTGGNPITDISLAIKGSEIQDSSVEVDENGMWSAADLQGEVTVTPVKADWTFDPPAFTVCEKDAGKKDINFVGQEIIFPGVETLTPGENTLDVETGAVVAVEFNQDVTEVDLTGITITDSGANPVGGVTASLSGRNLTINHADFNFNTIYTVTIPANTVENNDGVGNKDISWSFTTRNSLAPPTVSVLTPAENSTNVELAAVVSVEFDQNITEEDLSGISITTDSGSTTVAGVSASLSSRTITISHDDFDYNKTYTVTVPAGAVTNTDGIGNDEINWSFSTIVAYIFGESWGSQGSGDGEFTYPKGIAVDSSGNVYVVDTDNHRIQKFDSSGNFIAVLGSYGNGDGEFNYPIGIEIASHGYIYVAGNYNNRIQKFDSNGDFITSWGSNGSGDGEFYFPKEIAVDSSGNIYVVDTHNHRIQKFDSNGDYLTQWGSWGYGDGEFYFPEGIAIDSYDNVYVVDTDNWRIQKFDSNGNYLTQWGRDGNGDGEFSEPVGIAVDSYDNVYVVDCYNHRIQEFDSSGNYLTQWGNEGSGDGEFYFPYGIAVDSYGNVYVADTQNHRIQKFVPIE